MTSIAGGQPLNDQQVIRDLYRTIAEEVIERVDSDSVSGYALTVDSEQSTVTVENAFLEIISSRGRKVQLGPRRTREMLQLQVAVLSQNVRYESLEGGVFRRSINVSLEMRWQNPGDDSIVYGGILEQAKVDTVTARPGQDGDGGRSVVERIIEPAVVIAGAVVIIYLLFTVRS